jgi:hypothetical protein
MTQSKYTFEMDRSDDVETAVRWVRDTYREHERNRYKPGMTFTADHSLPDHNTQAYPPLTKLRVGPGAYFEFVKAAGARASVALDVVFGEHAYVYLDRFTVEIADELSDFQLELS